MSAQQSQTKTTAKPSSAPVSSGLLQRQCACGNHTVAGNECDECSKQGLTLQRASLSPNEREKEGQEAPPIVHEVLRSPGQPLDSATRSFFEPRFGYDLSQVRVHTDAKAAESVRTVNASAYTVGNRMVFGSEKYQPHSLQGQHLLAHELTHVIQQGKITELNPALPISNKHDSNEQEASALSDQFFHGDIIVVSQQSGIYPTQMLYRRRTDDQQSTTATITSSTTSTSTTTTIFKANDLAYVTGDTDRFGEHHGWVNFDPFENTTDSKNYCYGDDREQRKGKENRFPIFIFFRHCPCELPSFLKVGINKLLNDGRAEILIKEGKYKDKTAYISTEALKPISESNLREAYGPPATLTVVFGSPVKSKDYPENLQYDGKMSYELDLPNEKRVFMKVKKNDINVVTTDYNDNNTPLPPGKHSLRIPDEHHYLGRNYIEKSKFAETWFGIAADNLPRYLHCGRVSWGCATVTSLKDWDKLCSGLLCVRANPTDVGIIDVSYLPAMGPLTEEEQEKQRNAMGQSLFNDRPSVLQPKLLIGSVGGKYEHEAEMIADRIMRMQTLSLSFWHEQTGDVDKATGCMSNYGKTQISNDYLFQPSLCPDNLQRQTDSQQTLTKDKDEVLLKIEGAENKEKLNTVFDKLNLNRHFAAWILKAKENGLVTLSDSVQRDCEYIKSFNAKSAPTTTSTSNDSSTTATKFNSNQYQRLSESYPDDANQKDNALYFTSTLIYNKMKRNSHVSLISFITRPERLAWGKHTEGRAMDVSIDNVNPETLEDILTKLPNASYGIGIPMHTCFSKPYLLNKVKQAFEELNDWFSKLSRYFKNSRYSLVPTDRPTSSDLFKLKNIEDEIYAKLADYEQHQRGKILNKEEGSTVIERQVFEAHIAGKKGILQETFTCNGLGLVLYKNNIFSFTLSLGPVFGTMVSSSWRIKLSLLQADELAEKCLNDDIAKSIEKIKHNITIKRLFPDNRGHIHIGIEP